MQTPQSGAVLGARRSALDSRRKRLPDQMVFRSLQPGDKYNAVCVRKPRLGNPLRAVAALTSARAARTGLTGALTGARTGLGCHVTSVSTRVQRLVARQRAVSLRCNLLRRVQPQDLQARMHATGSL